MADKPTNTPYWVTTGTTTEPSASKKNTGWLALERPAYQWFNWLFQNIYAWIAWLYEATGGYTSVGAGTTYPRINNATSAGYRKIRLISDIDSPQFESVPYSNMVVDLNGYTIRGTVNYSRVLYIVGSNCKIFNGCIEGGFMGNQIVEISGNNNNIDIRIKSVTGATYNAAINNSGNNNKIYAPFENLGGTITTESIDTGIGTNKEERKYLTLAGLYLKSLSTAIDYTLTNLDGISLIHVTNVNGNRNITLFPDLTTNLDRLIEVHHGDPINNGKVLIKNGSTVIASLEEYGDTVRIHCDGTNFYIL